MLYRAFAHAKRNVDSETPRTPAPDDPLHTLAREVDLAVQQLRIREDTDEATGYA